VTIKAALTVEEWGRMTASGQLGTLARIHPTFGIELFDEVGLRPSEAHATAALCLHNQDFGFTREDVKLVHSVGAWHDNAGVMVSLRNLADRIEALLPPEDFHDK